MSVTIKAQPNIYYREEVIIFGKILCYQCGSDQDLRHVELRCINENQKIISTEKNLCLDCLRDLPSLNNDEA